MIMNIVRIAKVVALLAFVLPWVAVSCNGTDLATASGIELIQGTMSENPDAANQMAAAMGMPPGETTSGSSSMETPELEMNIFALAAAVVVAVGLGLSFLGRIAPAATLATSLLAAGLVYGAVWQFKELVKTDMAEQQGGGAAGSMGDMSAMNQMGASMLNEMVQERLGFWLAIGGLLVAAGASGIALASKGGGASVRPDSM